MKEAALKQKWLARRIEFAIRFAFEDDLDGLYRSGDWSNLRDDLDRFLDYSDVSGGRPLLGTLYSPNPKPSKLSDDELRELQQDFRRLLDPVASRSDLRRRSMVSVGPLEYGPVEFGRVLTTVRGPGRDCVLDMLNGILGQSDPRPIVRCPAPDCGRVFYRRGKQVFCSRTCTNREMAQRKRRRDAEAEQKKAKTKGGSRGKKKQQK